MLKPYEPHFTITKQIGKNIETSELLNKEIALNNSSTIKKPFLYGKDTSEQEAYYKAHEELIRQGSNQITLDFLRKINSIVTLKPSNYQIDGAEIKNSKKELVYLSPAYPEVFIQTLIDWLYSKNSITVQCPIKAAIAHYQFVKIHPFSDGNGRTTRLLSTLILNQGGYKLSCCYELEEYFETNIEVYYNALDFRKKNEAIELYNERKDITSWIEYFCTSLLNCLKK